MTELGRAATCFDGVLAVNPEDQTARCFSDRTRHLLREGLPPD